MDILAERVGTSWPGISTAAVDARAEREELGAEMDSKGLIPTDSAFVAFGSLARLEHTSGSDKEPGPTGVFGGLSFSHDLIQAIGGEDDTNTNTTRRILLLLESCVVGQDAGVRDRVIRHLFWRYIGEDRGYHRARKWDVKVPRFLLNDIVRFWRTMAVDYASKRRDRASKGWALRNFKLRLSRKLIFVSGLAMCLCCHLLPSKELTDTNFRNEEHFNQVLVDYLVGLSGTPLSVVAAFCLDFDAIDAGRAIFDSYEQFLAILDDKPKRDHLYSLDVDEANKDELFQEARGIATSFQDGLSRLFFQTDIRLTEATQRYGVF